MLQEIICLTFIYICLIAFLNSPKKTATESTAIESTATETITPESTATKSTATESTATESTATESTATESTATESTATETITPELSKMTIRQLKALAKSIQLKGYGNMRKSELVLALS